MIKTTRLIVLPRKTSHPNICLFSRLPLTFAVVFLLSMVGEAQSPRSNPSNCENLYLTEAREAYSKHFPETEPRTPQKILGVALDLTKDETRYLTEMLGSELQKEWISLPKTCKRALCALTHFLKSEESAMRVLIMAKQFGYFYWLKSDPTPVEITPLTQLEIRHISRAIQKLPSEFRGLRGLKYIVRAPKGLIFHSNEFSNLGLSKRGATFGKRIFTGFIYLFDKGISNKSPSEIQLLTLKQIGAHVDMSVLESAGKRWSETRDYLNALNWTLSRGLKNSATGPVVYEKWHTSNNFAPTPNEEFTEGFALFLVEPQSLNQKNPTLFQFMKSQVFKTSPTAVPVVNIDRIGFAKIVETCFLRIQKITETRHGLEIEGQNGRRILRAQTGSSLSDDIDLAQLECLPPEPTQSLTTELCDQNDTDRNGVQNYLPVLNAIGQVIDGLHPSKLETFRQTCFKNGIFTKNCLLGTIKIPLVDETTSKIIAKDLLKKTVISVFSDDHGDNLRWLTSVFPLKRFGHECLFSMMQSFQIDKNEIMYFLNQDSKKRSGLSDLNNCGSLDLKQLSVKPFESDDQETILKILTSVPTVRLIYENIFNTVLTAGKRCQTFYSNTVTRDCLSKELQIDLAPLAKSEPWLVSFYEKLITKYTP